MSPCLPHHGRNIMAHIVPEPWILCSPTSGPILRVYLGTAAIYQGEVTRAEVRKWDRNIETKNVEFDIMLLLRNLQSHHPWSF